MSTDTDPDMAERVAAIKKKLSAAKAAGMCTFVCVCVYIYICACVNISIHECG